MQEVDKICSDAELFVWVKVLSVPMNMIEQVRLWGTWCSCHEYYEKTPCPWKSRRLHEVPFRLQTLIKELMDWQRSLTLVVCDGVLSLMLEAQEFVASSVHSECCSNGIKFPVTTTTGSQ